VATRWRLANGTPAVEAGTEGADDRSLTEGLDDLLGGTPDPAPSATPPAPVPVDLGDLLSASGSYSVSGPANPGVLVNDAGDEVKTTAAGGTMDFDELLKSL
jgi:hypothetical protein